MIDRCPAGHLRHPAPVGPSILARSRSRRATTIEGPVGRLGGRNSGNSPPSWSQSAAQLTGGHPRIAPDCPDGSSIIALGSCSDPVQDVTAQRGDRGRLPVEGRSLPSAAGSLGRYVDHPDHARGHVAVSQASCPSAVAVMDLGEDSSASGGFSADRQPRDPGRSLGEGGRLQRRGENARGGDANDMVIPPCLDCLDRVIACPFVTDCMTGAGGLGGLRPSSPSSEEC